MLGSVAIATRVVEMVLSFDGPASMGFALSERGSGGGPGTGFKEASVLRVLMIGGLWSMVLVLLSRSVAVFAAVVIAFGCEKIGRNPDIFMGLATDADPGFGIPENSGRGRLSSNDLEPLVLVAGLLSSPPKSGRLRGRSGRVELVVFLFPKSDCIFGARARCLEELAEGAKPSGRV